MNENIEKVVRIAEERVGDFDAIIDLYAMGVAWISHETADLLGYLPSEICEKPIFSISTLAGDKKKELLKIILHGGGEIEKIPLMKKNGDVVLLNTKFSPIEVDGQPYYVVKITSGLD
ncbi:MAG: hypothetical protein ABH950_05390 [Candidatus Altiarchaeota archaeon]